MKRAVLVYSLLVLLVIHFFFILYFTFPNNKQDTFLFSVSTKYVHPVFTQNFRMFAPNPPLYTIKLFYRCTFSAGEKSEWVNPGAGTLKKFQNVRMGNYAQQYGIYESIYRELKYADYLSWDLLDGNSLSKQEQFERLKKDGRYKLANRYFTEKAKEHFPNKKITHIDFVCADVIIPDMNNKFIKPEYKFSTYPVIIIND